MTLQKTIRIISSQGIKDGKKETGFTLLEVMLAICIFTIGLLAIAAMHVAGHARDVEGLAAIVTFDDRDHLGCGLRLVHQPADPER